MRVLSLSEAFIQPKTSLSKLGGGFRNISKPHLSRRTTDRMCCARARRPLRTGASSPSARTHRSGFPSSSPCSTWVVSRDQRNFSRLVLGWIDSYDSNQILMFSGFSRSTKLSGWIFRNFCKNLQKISGFRKNQIFFAKIRKFRKFFFKILRFPQKIATFSKNHLDSFVYLKKLKKCVFGCKNSFRYSREQA